MKTKNSNSIYMVLIVGLAMGIIGSLVFSAFIGVILALVTGGGIYFINNSKKSDNKNQDQTIKTEKTENSVEKSLDALMNVNIGVRENNLPEKVISKTEEVIDLLQKVIPALTEKYPESQLRFTIDRMPTEYLPKLLNPYISLEEEARKDAEDKVVETLDAMQKEVQDVLDMINNHKQKDFDQKAAFMAHRFSENY